MHEFTNGISTTSSRHDHLGESFFGKPARLFHMHAHARRCRLNLNLRQITYSWNIARGRWKLSAASYVYSWNQIGSQQHCKRRHGISNRFFGGDHLERIISIDICTCTTSPIRFEWVWRRRHANAACRPPTDTDRSCITDGQIQCTRSSELAQIIYSISTM